ncbi:MAG: PaaX family transcriptional regulator C-terminal domain-containing protein [Pseudomonadota bacterium]
MSDSAQRALDTLIDDFHAQERIRVWSLVITIFGDAINPRGGELWLGSLQELMDRIRIEPSAVRAAMSRLTADGWLTRIKHGRKSYYRLADAGLAEFADATRAIYAPRRHTWSGKWSIIVLNGRAGDEREARRRELRAAGFGALAPNILLRPESLEDTDTLSKGPDEIVFQSNLDKQSDATKLIKHGWMLSDLEGLSAELVSKFSMLYEALRESGPLDPVSAMAARSLVIHDFRRLALRVPHLPAELLPESWTGDEARALVASVYRVLAGPSEQWLDGCLDSHDARIPAPEFSIARRFEL